MRLAKLARVAKQTLSRGAYISAVALFAFSSMSAVLPAFSGVASADSGVTLYVDARNGDDSNTCADLANACKTITKALSYASSGDTISVEAGTYNESGINIDKDGITLIGAGRTSSGTVLNVPDSAQVNGFDINANNVTIENFDIEGPVNSSYQTYAWSSNVSRGIAVHNGYTGFNITNNTIENLRNDVLIDGRNTGSVTNNIIDNSKSGISVQYTDAGTGNTEGYGITISGNQEGTYGNEWGVNVHLNGHYSGSTYYSNSQKIATDAPSSVQASLLTNSANNNGWTVQDQGYSSSNRTTVSVGGSNASDANQGSPLNQLATIQAGVNAVVSGGTVNVESDLTTSQQLTLTKAVTLDGNGHTISPAFTKTSSDNNAAIGIQASNVTIKDLTEDGTNGTSLHGINVYVSTGVNLDNVTIKNNDHAALIVNGSAVNASNFDTSNNTWGSVNVDPGSGVTDPSVFTLNSGTLAEANQIWSDGSHVTGTATVTVNAPSGYDHYYLSDTGYNIWTNDLTHVASLSHSSTTTYYSTIQAAVNASSSNDTINVAPGTYNEAVSVSHPLTINGAQAGVDARTRSVASSHESTVEGFSVSNSNATIDGFTLSPRTNNGGVGVSFHGGTSESVQNNIISNYGSEGVALFGTSGLTIQQNLFTSPASSTNSQDGIYAGTGNSDNLKIQNNKFIGASTINGADMSLSFTGGSSPVVSNNYSSGGVTLVALFNSSNAQISSNTFVGDPNISESDLYIGGGNNVTTITGNTVSGGYYGVALRNNFGDGANSNTTITGNNLSNNYGGGISATSTAVSSGQTVIASQNDLSSTYSNTYGVYNSTAATVDASQNWWGATTNSTITPLIGGTGTVLYQPYYLDATKTSLSNQASLSNLTASKGTLNPTFSSSASSYTASVGYTISSLSIGTTASTGASVSGDGSHNLSVGSNKFTLTVTSADGTVSNPYTLTVTRAAATQTVVSSTGTATVTSSQPQVVVTNTSTPVTITVASGTTNASIDYSTLKISSTSAIVPKTTINSSTANVVIPASTTITATSGTWDGTITAPTVKPSTSVTVPVSTGTVNTIGTVIEVGSDTANLTFSKAVKLTIPGQANMQVGFERNGTFTKITTQCSANTQAAGDALPAGGDCYIVSGNDMVVWTKHFTKFVTYTVSNKYVVKSGDTFSGIAASAGLTLAQLEQLNPDAGHPAGNFSLIMPGDVLRLGGAVAQSSASTSSSAKVLGAKTNKPSHTAISAASTTTPSFASASASPKTASKLLGLRWYWWLAILAVVAAMGAAVYVYRQTGEKR